MSHNRFNTRSFWHRGDAAGSLGLRVADSCFVLFLLPPKICFITYFVCRTCGQRIFFCFCFTALLRTQTYLYAASSRNHFTREIVSVRPWTLTRGRFQIISRGLNDGDSVAFRIVPYWPECCGALVFTRTNTHFYPNSVVIRLRTFAQSNVYCIALRCTRFKSRTLILVWCHKSNNKHFGGQSRL